MRNRERNQGDRQKGTFEKVRSNSYMFQNFKIRSVERNQTGIENNIKLSLIGLEESDRNQDNSRLLRENPVFLVHI